MSQVDEGSNRRHEPENLGVAVVANSQPADEAASFVERETRGRKRLLRFYLMLLAIPVALAVVVLIFGRSDRRVVMDEIQTQAPPIVQREVGEQIKPTIKSEVQTQISPTLGEIDGLKTRQVQIEEAAGSLKISQEETTATLRKENEALKTELKNDLKKLDNGVNERLSNLGSINERLKKLEALDERLIRLERQSIEGRLKNLETQIKELSGRRVNNGNQFPQPKKSP
jgi:hypothetical protein